mgnify:CR=1 FL=1
METKDDFESALLRYTTAVLIDGDFEEDTFNFWCKRLKEIAHKQFEIEAKIKVSNDAVKTIEKVSGKKVDLINIIGGGSKDRYLNELTKKYTGKRVLAGPTEATAIGNIIAQLMFADKELVFGDGENEISGEILIKNE